MPTDSPHPIGGFTKFEAELRSLARRGRTLEKTITRALTERDTRANLALLRLYRDTTQDQGDRIAEHRSARTEPTDFEVSKFVNDYQKWYSLSRRVIRDVLPEREEDFVSQYTEVAKGRTIFGRLISDSLSSGLLADGDLLARIRIQRGIVDAARDALESRLFAIQDTLYADVFDSELGAAGALCSSGFLRGAGAMAGVVLETHLVSLCRKHDLQTGRKPQLSGLNEALKKADRLEVAQWRHIQHLGDLRNKCVHKSQSEPTKGDVMELIDGVAKVVKTVH